ncbi:MAG: S-layer homology domain-containing protein [Clostridia bacterium]|nr:S-layer homology domain-containing protein [Clostridia bacterium]
MKKRKVLALLLAIAMVTAMLPVAAMAASDIDGHWAQQAMQSFIDDGYLKGYEEGTYGPDVSISRAEYAALINRVTGLSDASASLDAYTDVSPEQWFYTDIKTALTAGYMNGTSPTTMSPMNTITREQAVTMVARVLNLPEADESILDSFADSDKISQYAKGAFAAMVQAGYLQGNEAGEIMPQRALSRAEGVTLLYRTEGALKDALNNTLESENNENNDDTQTTKTDANTSGGSSSGGSSGGGGGGSSRITSGYVLMNIPYDEFYKAELGENDPTVDAVTSATRNKPRTGTLAGGSYHVNSDGSDITGIIYPVYVRDMSRLSGYTKITDESSVDITVTNRGQTTTTTYSGKDALFESASYSYYVMTGVPARYKIWNEDGTFSAVMGKASSVEGVEAEVTVGARHADIEISLTGTEGVAQGDTVSGVVVTFSDGSKMGLRHIANLWRGTEIGGSIADLGGKTITNIRYIKQDAVYDYPVNIEISDADA